MKHLSALLLTAILSTNAYAGIAFFKYDYISGSNKICVYDDMGSSLHVTIASYKLCPLSINT